MKLLIVTDTADLSDALASTLQCAGYSTVAATDAETGRQVWRVADPELLLIDVGLPEQQGWDLCQQVREAGETPIILLGTGEGRASAIRGLALGADDYVRVPFDAAELLARVCGLLRRAQSRSTGTDIAVTA